MSHIPRGSISKIAMLLCCLTVITHSSIAILLMDPRGGHIATFIAPLACAFRPTLYNELLNQSIHYRCVSWCVLHCFARALLLVFCTVNYPKTSIESARLSTAFSFFLALPFARCVIQRWRQPLLPRTLPLTCSSGGSRIAMASFAILLQHHRRHHACLPHVHRRYQHCHFLHGPPRG